MNDNETFYELIVEGPTRPTAAEPLQPSRSVLCLSTQDQRREKRLRVTDEEDLSAAESSISIGRVTGRNKGKSVIGAASILVILKCLNSWRKLKRFLQ